MGIEKEETGGGRERGRSGKCRGRISGYGTNNKTKKKNNRKKIP